MLRRLIKLLQHECDCISLTVRMPSHSQSWNAIDYKRANACGVFKFRRVMGLSVNSFFAAQLGVYGTSFFLEIVV
jgi:hypothetical protein